MSLLRDERGSLSSARFLLVIWTLVTIGLLVAEAAVRAQVGRADVQLLSNAAWGIVSAVQIALIAWAGGPRAMQYLGPQVGAVARSIASAVRDVRLPSMRDDHRDDTWDAAAHRADAGGDGPL